MSTQWSWTNVPTWAIVIYRFDSMRKVRMVKLKKIFIRHECMNFERLNSMTRSQIFRSAFVCDGLNFSDKSQIFRWHETSYQTYHLNRNLSRPSIFTGAEIKVSPCRKECSCHVQKVSIYWLGTLMASEISRVTRMFTFWLKCVIAILKTMKDEHYTVETPGYERGISGYAWLLQNTTQFIRI